MWSSAALVFVPSLLAGFRLPRKRSCDLTPSQNALLQAVLEGDLPALENLFLTDPLAAAIGPERGTRLFRSMVAATSNCLPASLQQLPAGA